MQVQALGHKDPLEEAMATHSSIHAWRIPWTEEPGGLQSIGLQSWSQLKRLSTHTWYDEGLFTGSFGTKKFLSLLTSLQVFVENQLMVSL